MSDFDPETYWQERLKRKWGLEGVGFFGLGPYYNRWLYRVQSKVFFRCIERLALSWSTMDVLDIGSGTGHYVGLWNALGVRSVTCADIATIAVQKLRKKFPHSECYKLDIGAPLPQHLQNRSYDIVSAFSVLYHIVDDNRYQRSFENVHQLLRPHGTFIFSENFIHAETIRAETQVIRSLNEIQAILENTGFKVKARVPVFAIMNNPIDSTSALAKLFWRITSLAVGTLKLPGFALGGLLYPFELLLTSCLKEGPSTELMICEKYGHSASSSEGR